MKFLFKGVDFFPHDTRWKIIERRYIFIGLSWALAVFSAVLLMTRGLNYGVDFKGGSLIEVQSKGGPLNVGELRARLDKLGIGEVQVQGVGAGNEALIRVAQQEQTKELNEEKAQAAANDKVRAALGENIEVRRVEVVGPTVSDELKWTGVKAVVAAMAGILLYVWFRFEWQFGVAAILALSHDVFITIGMFSLLWYEFDLSVVAAILTLAGYSVNDTVVVFDRIRENLRRYKRMPLIDLLNLSINETLSRTVLTSVTTALAVLALYIFGTQVIHGFSFAMLFGIVIGTYSSIFVAAPFLLLFGVKREWGPAAAKLPAAGGTGSTQRRNATTK
ncbi:MAG TPA: protein translocase subunit SecF [Reyranella sp.]|nr:protein translocase subunit SecF [Reyranella sp.]